MTPASGAAPPASRRQRARAHRAAGLAGVRRPAGGAGLRHHRHGAGGALFGARPGGAGGRRGAPTSRSSSASWAWCWRSAPIVGQFFGARQLRRGRPPAAPGGVAGAGAGAAGQHAAGLSRRPSWRWRRPSPEVAAKVRGYLLALAFALPAALLFTAYRGFNIAVSRPKAVMALQLGGLALKVPLSAALVFGRAGAGPAGAGRGGLRHRHRDGDVGAAAGGAGGCCGATRSTRRFALGGRGLRPPDRHGLRGAAAAGRADGRGRS